MATKDVQSFAGGVEALALALRSEELPGLLSKRLEVPQDVCALVEREGETPRLLGEGEAVGGRFRALLVKARDVVLSFEVEGLRSRDDHEVTAGIEIVVRLPRTEIGMRQLADTLMAEREVLEREALRAYLAPAIRIGLGGHVAEREVDTLMRTDPREALAERLRTELEPLMFAAGLELLEARFPSFYCEAYEALRRERAQAQAEAQRLRERERLQEMRARLERHEHVKRQEVEAFARKLRYQGVLEELELRDEVDRRRTEEKLERFQRLYDQLGHDETKALIFMLDDERLKAELLRELIRRDMTPEQLRAVQLDELERRLEQRLAEFSRHVDAVHGERQARMAHGGTETRRLYVALGKQVLGFDPHAGEAAATPCDRFDFTTGALGWIRSVRLIGTRFGPAIAAGAQLGVYLVRLGEGTDRTVEQLRFAEQPRGRGGVNAVAAFDGYIYATHSELGVVRWDEHRLREPEPLFREVTARNDATRGVQVSADGKLYFSSGPDVYRHDLLHRERDLVCYRGGAGSITGFVANRHEVFAGTRGGRVLRWSVEDPLSVRELNVRKGGPIYMLRTAEIGGAQHLLIGAKEHGITAVSLEDGRAFDYRAPEAIRWVDGATDLVFGISRDGYSVHLWEAERLEAPRERWRVDACIQDLWLDKAPMVEGGRC